jgi:hypothetical protein
MAKLRRNPRGYTGRGRKKIRAPKGMTWKKARLILHHGAVRGYPLTRAQRGMFGAWFQQLKPKGHSYEWYKREALKLEKKKKKAKKKLSKKSGKKKKLAKKKGKKRTVRRRARR